jgi:hypothetical protein
MSRYAPFDPTNPYQRRRSPYAPLEEDEEEQSPLMRNAVAQNAGGYGKYGGGQFAQNLAVNALANKSLTGDEEAPASTSKYATAGNASWLTAAPEASGAEPFSTTPENRGPREETPISKNELPRVDEHVSRGESKYSAAWEAAAKKQEEIDKLHKKLNSFGGGLLTALVPGVTTGMRSDLAQLRAEHRDLEQQAMYQDNRRGGEIVPRSEKVIIGPDGKRQIVALTRDGRQVNVGQAPEDPRVESARVKQQNQEKAMTSPADVQGLKYYWDPEEKTYKPLSTKGKESILDVDNPEVPPPAEKPIQFPVPHEGKAGTIHNLPENVPSYIDATGKIQKNPNYVAPADRKPGGAGEKEDPIEKRAAAAAQAAMQKALFAAPDDQVGAQGIYDNTYAAVKRTLSRGKGGELAPETEPGTKKNFRDKKTKRIVPHYLDKKGKWQPIVGPVASHQQ